MFIRTLSSIAVALPLMFGVGAARGAEIEYTHDPQSGLNFISVIGRLELHDDKAFIRSSIELDNAIVVFHSEGGNLVAGIEIGKAIRLKGFSTLVLSGGTCASSCAIAWLGGIKRFLTPTSRIGFHAAYTEDNGVASETGMGNALVGAYLNQLGLSQSAIAYITYASPNDMTWLNANDAQSLGIEVAMLPSDEDSTVQRELPEPLATPKPGLSPPPYPSTSFKRIVDADIFGFDLAGMPLRNMTPESCQTACADETSCKAYTYNNRNHACFLKSGGSRVVGHPAAMSGYKVEIEATLQQSPITIFERTDLPGGDYNEVRDVSLESCISLCEDDRRCKAFTYVNRYKQCWLKSSITDSESKKMAISGIKSSGRQ